MTDLWKIAQFSFLKKIIYENKKIGIDSRRLLVLLQNRDLFRANVNLLADTFTLDLAKYHLE